MKKNLTKALICLGLFSFAKRECHAQISLLQDYKNYTAATIGTFQGISFKEAGFSALCYIPGTDGKEFWVCSDRGVNIDAGNANPSGCRPTYDKIFSFPGYAPKIHRIRINGDSIQVLRTISIKAPTGADAKGVLLPTGFGSTASEQASTDTVQNCSNFNSKIAAKEIWSIDAEGICVDKDGNFYVSEENGPTIWKINPNGVVIKRYSPYANLAGAQPQDVLIDTAFKYRKNNRGFESVAVTPNGKIYAIIQSPILYPNSAAGENTRIHRMIEIDPATNQQRMLAYVNDGIIGSGSSQIRLKDWKIGDMTAINDSTFLVLEAAARGNTDIKRMYKVNINGATAFNSGLYGGQTVEQLVDSAGLVFQGIFPVKKTLFMDLLASGWPANLEKAEGLAIINDSTIALVNDNDYGQISPAEDGVATATGILSHLITFGLQGNKKLTGFVPVIPTLSQGRTALNSSSAPYLVPTASGVEFTALMTVKDAADNGYKMVGIPDGMGAFDNGNGTMTVVMNHELGNTSGIARAHGQKGAFVSKWIIDKTTLSVLSGADLMQTVKLWNTATSSYITYNSSFTSSAAAFSRFCSADLPAVHAFYNPVNGKGTMERIFMNGEENGSEGRGMAHIITGPEAGTSYELPRLGKFSWENALAWPGVSDTTMVIGTDDATPGQIYVYIGTKQQTGNTIEKAGLTNGKLFGVKVSGMTLESNSAYAAPNTAFALSDLGNVENMTGAAINTASNNLGITNFLRPEDGAWDPSNLNDFYFATTNGFGSPSRLWRLRFTDAAQPSLGGTITAVLEGTEGQQMLDNITIDHSGHILLVEDVGNNAHVGKMWQYDIAADTLVQIAAHDTTRFLNNARTANYLTQDEEASGVIDVQEVMGPGMFLLVDQAHYSISGEFAEGGQMLALYNPATAQNNPEIEVKGNNITINDGSTATAAGNNTDFGMVAINTPVTKTFTIHNTGSGNLNISAIYITGANASEFSLVNTTLPLNIAANSSQNINIQFSSAVLATRHATVNIVNSDFSESTYDFAIKADLSAPEIEVTGNNISILNGDLTPGLANYTDFGTVSVGGQKTAQFVIRNTGNGDLVVTGISFTGTHASEFSIQNAPSFPLTIAGSSNHAIDVKFMPLQTGIRTANINIASNDADEAAYIFALQGIAADPTGIDPVFGSASYVKLYPNPTHGNAMLSLSLKNDERVIVQVSDITGRMVLPVFDKQLSTGEQQIPLPTEGLANGTYFVQVASTSGTKKLKLVVAH